MNVPSWAVRGAKVVCIKRGEWKLIRAADVARKPAFGDICVVESVAFDMGILCLTLEGYGDHRFAIRRFRPLVTRTAEQDAEMFRNLLVTEGADA